MDGRSILLAKIPHIVIKDEALPSEKSNLKYLSLSSSLKHVLLIDKNTLSLFCLLKQSDFEHKGANLVWEDKFSDLESIIFSDDGKQFGLLNNSQPKKLILYNIHENIISKECESFIAEFGQSLSTNSRWDDICDSSVGNRRPETVLIHLKKSNVVIYSCGHLYSFYITRSNECQQNYLISFTTDVMCYYYDIHYFYYLDCSGIVYKYLLENGNLVCMQDIYKTLPRSLMFNKLCIDSKGTRLALLGSNNQVYVIDITPLPLVVTTFPQSSAPASSSVSVSSFKTSTSKTSNKSRVDSLRGEPSNKTSGSIAGASTVSSSWFAYLERLTNRKKIVLGKEEECTSFISIQDVPNTYIIRSLHFCQDSLAVWASHVDGTSDGFYRLYNTSTGQLDSADILASDTQVIPVDTPKVSIDLFIQSSNICLPLGVISRDTLVQKMVGGENESLVGEMIGQAVLPLPLLKEGLDGLQIDMVRLALNLHTQGVKLKLTEAMDVVDNLIISVKHMFETILSALDEHDSGNKWCQQIKRLSLTHANTLLSLLQSPEAQTSLQSEILHYIVILRRGEAILVDVPDIPQWTSWLMLSDEEVIFNSITSLALVRCFLILHRSWTEEDFKGRRFFNTVNRVFLNLLKEKRLDEAINLLEKVNLDSTKELQSLILTCQDLTLRDFLFSNVSKVLQDKHYDAWKYVTLLESVLRSYKQYFPLTSDSPLKISDVLTLSSKDKQQITTDLFFSTGEHRLQQFLEKNSSWDYLLSHNYTEGISYWLTSKSTDSKFSWPEQLFLQWDVDEPMVDQVVNSDCTDLTKLIVCNHLALRGIITIPEKCSPEKLILRMAYAEVFPDIETVLAQGSSNLSYRQFSDVIYLNAVENNLVAVVNSFNQSEYRCHKECPDWLKLLSQHIAAGKSWSIWDISEVIEGTTQYLASSEHISTISYLKKHPTVALVTDVINNENVCQLHSHVSPLLAACTPSSLSSNQSVDITLYSILAHTVPFHTDNIYQHQINTKQSRVFPDFKNANLSLRYGTNYSLGVKEFIKQGRSASAFSYILQKGKSSVRKKVSVNQTHGLALSNACSYGVTSACFAFTELLGQDSTLLRTHIKSAISIKNCTSKQKLKALLLNLTQGKENGPSELLQELEKCFLNLWESSDDNWICCLHDFQLVVRLSSVHNLPPPQGLLMYCLETRNWLLCLIAAQLFQLPLTTVEQASTTKSTHILSKHIFYALQNSISNHSESEPNKTFQPEKNLFACLAATGNNANILLSRSHKLNSPALALLASSLQPVPTETGLSMWLVASLLPEDVSLCPSPPWTPDSVIQLLELVVKQGYFYTLARAFSVYQPTSPCCAVANFLVDGVVKHSFKESLLNLKVFMAAFINMPSEDTKKTNFLVKKSWIATAAYRMVCTALAYCLPSRYLRFCFLKTLCEAKFSEVIKDSQCFPLYLRLSESLVDTSLELDWQRLCLHQDCSQLLELLSSLTEQHLFDVAFQFAQIANLQSDQVLTTQWSVLALSEKREDRDFWKQCDEKFQQAKMKPHFAVSFYRSQEKMCSKLHERYVLLKYALSWLRKASATKEEITSLQTELYMTCLQDNFKTEALTEGVWPAPLRCLSNSLVFVLNKSPPELKASQSHRLDVLIHQLLSVGDIRTAFELQALFHHTNQDCELILACMRLAERVMTVSQLPSRIQQYLIDEVIKRPKIPLSSPFSKSRFQSKSSGSDNQEILSALYALQAHQTCSTTLFGNIISAFKVSVDLSCDYKDIILDSEPLNRLLPTHEIETAASLLSLASLTRSECSQYICSQIVSILNNIPDDGRYTLWGCDLEKEFSYILDLSSSALLLGNLLLSSDPLIAPSSEPSSYKQVVELLVLAHNCFTKVCHMEGIAAVLNLSRSLVNSLLDCCQWPLMVRLLTGVGRYNEMNYVFQILKSNDRFEFLLGKGLNKQPQLMAATLEFVRRDKELFSLVAHHFSMYGELAALYEEEASAELGRLARATSDGLLLVSAHNKACLQAALSKYSDAAEHYMQAKKMKCGVASVQQAELIAVQLLLMTNSAGSTSVPCLVNLTQAQALELANTVLSCDEAYIVANAYNISVDWSSALFFNCVVKGDVSYFRIWTKHHQLSQSVVQDVVRRFQSERETSQSVEMNMKRFVSSISLLDVKYRVASQLGFKDILQSLLNNPDMAYLKDTVWQSGFKKLVL